MSGDAWRRFAAPAKINLFLRVLGRREDGYHELETLFQLLDWGDEVLIATNDSDRITRVGDNAGIDGDIDLVVRAARLLKAERPSGAGAAIRVDKRIPIGGGLGGGSSNAATVLVALNRLWGLDLDIERLAVLGRTLGADVPVFIRGHSAYARGVGERLTPVRLGPRHYVIVDPGIAVSTAEIFADAGLTRHSTPLTIAGCFEESAWSNDLEAVARRRFKAIALMLDWLGGAGVARLSGSGGCGFVELPSAVDANALARCVPDGWRAWAVRGVDRVSLLGGWD